MIRSEITHILLRHRWFSSLPQALIDLIIDKSVQREVAGGTLIYGTGDPPAGQFAVLSGEVRLVANSDSGKHILYRVLGPGGWFGHLSVLDLQPRFQDAVAAAPTCLLHLSMPAFNAIIDQHPRYALHFAQLACQDLRVAMSMLAEMKATSLPNRVAQVLLETADAAALMPAGSSRLTQESLAAMVGTSRQTVNRVLRNFEARNLICIEYGGVVVRNRALLAAAAGRDPTGMRPQRQVGPASPRRHRRSRRSVEAAG